MIKRSLFIFSLLAVVALSVYYRREKVRSSTDYNDVLRYSRMSEVGISVDYNKEPLLAWKIVSGPKKLELTGGGEVLTCMDEHLIFGHLFEPLQKPANLGEALDRCKRKSREQIDIDCHSITVIPAKAGTHDMLLLFAIQWARSADPNEISPVAGSNKFAHSGFMLLISRTFQALCHSFIRFSR